MSCGLEKQIKMIFCTQKRSWIHIDIHTVAYVLARSKSSASRCSYSSSTILNRRCSRHSNCSIICNRCGILYTWTNSLAKSQNGAANNYRGTSNHYWECGLQVEHQEQRARLRGFVMKSDWKPLLSGLWFEKLCLNRPEIYMMIKGKVSWSWRRAEKRFHFHRQNGRWHTAGKKMERSPSAANWGWDICR